MKRFHPSARATTVPRRANTGRLQVRVESLEFAGKSWPAGEGMGLKSPGTDKRLVQDATDREARAALSSNEAEPGAEQRNDGCLSHYQDSTGKEVS